MTQGDNKISEGAKIWADSKSHTYPIAYTVLKEDITTHPGDQGGFYRNRTVRSSPWAWENFTANIEKIIVIRRHLLRSGTIQKSVTHLKNSITKD